jgi:hypothetical protein
MYMFSRGHHTAIFIVPMFMLLVMKDLLAKFIITCTLKDKLTTWLCLVEGYLASLHDLVSFKIPSTNLASNLSNFFPFFRIKHLQPKTWK